MRIVTRPYAEALFAAAGGLEAARGALAELEAVAAALRAQPRARELLAYPSVAPDLAEALLRTLTGRCSLLVARFLRLLVDKGRVEQLEAILQALRQRVEREEGVVRAQVQTARPIGEEALEALRQALGRRLGARVHLTPEVRPELIGGARVVVGDRVLDGSLAAHLQRLHRRLRAAG